MKKNIVVLIAALCAVNGIWAVMQPTKMVNDSATHAISVSGALGKFYTLAPKGKLVEVVSMGVKTKRGNFLNFESGAQNDLAIKVGTVNPITHQFEHTSGVTYSYNLKIIKRYFAHVREVTFNANDSVTLTGTLQPTPSAFQNGVNLAGRCANKEEAEKDNIKCSVVSRPPDQASNIASATVIVLPKSNSPQSK
jgi:hypothetical protein